MKISRRHIITAAIAVIAVVVMVVAAFTTSADTVYGTFWSMVPPVIAIALALVTKEVYSSLFFGILAGALLYTGFNFEGTVLHVVQGGLLAVLTDSYNIGIIIFPILLGAIVALMNKAGGSAAFGRWASEHIHSRVGAQIATIILGCLIFVDDYFNCLTVGSVMRPVCDKHNVSRAKLSYLIDATAAPVCIIAPISSWAAAVAGFVDGEDGLSLFIRSIPFNFYALLTIAMMFALVLLKADFGSMAIHERNAVNGDIFTVAERPFAEEEGTPNPRGRVIDLVFPVVALIVCCVVAMLYTGGFFSGTSFVDSFAGCDASLALVIGCLISLIITIAYYMIRRVLSFKECMDCIPEGFKAMVPAVMILTLAWTIKAMTDSLGAQAFVEAVVGGNAGAMMNFLPAIIFLIAVGMSFATGTSWGTFGILIPIVVDAFSYDPSLMIVAISACMAGAVCGDHCSPISDTTIMASAGAQCDHVTHVSTQLPYAMTVAIISFVTYIVAGFTRSAWISLPVGAVLLVAVLLVLRSRTAKQAA